MLSLDDYNYHLPPELIANAPASPRDSARLFVYDTKTDKVTFDTFRNIDRYLPKPSLLIFNNTKVVPARLWLKKESGGKVQVLLMMNLKCAAFCQSLQEFAVLIRWLIT